MPKNKKWTLEEDSILIAQVNANPKSIMTGLEKAGKLTGRTTAACINRWYTILRNKQEEVVRKEPTVLELIKNWIKKLW